MRGKRIIFSLILCLSFVEGWAQVFETQADGASEDVVVANGFWKHWFVQVDLDMSLQNPYGYDFKDVFPNGKSFGLDLAAGKWFSHQVGVRAIFNWENKLPLLKNDHAEWLAPFHQPGVNRDKGGYIALYGDVLLNIHNLFGAYRQNRAWNLSAYPRFGVNYNFGVTKGALALGMGLLNTYRLNERWSLLADASYVMCGSGFVGVNRSGGTGVGTGSNGYFSIGMGAQYDLGGKKDDARGQRQGVLTNSIWDNWFVQAGMDMCLMNPYGYDFSKVIPKGQTYGVNVSLGKWFTPEFALRARVQWENGLIENRRVEWVPPTDNPRQNYQEGGIGVASVEAVMNVTNITAGYEPERKWQTSAYMRAGIITQFVTGSASPIAGAGIEETYRLNDKLSLIGALGYQVTTSEGMGVSTTGMEVAAGTNGFFNIDLGIAVDLGRNKFCRNKD